MRTIPFLSTGLALTGIVLAGVLLSAHRQAPSAILPQASAAIPPAVAVAPEPSAGSSQPAVQLAAAAPGDDLPVIEVPERVVHSVPDEEPPPQPVTLKGRDGRDMRPRSATQLAARPAMPAPSPSPAPMPMIRGAAHVGDVVSLMVQGRTVPLFGVKAPQAGDRCAAAPQMAPRSCGEVARAALAARLKANPAVSCRIPPGQRAAVPGAICLDSTGVDLAGFLIGEGLALADPAQSYDYAGAENVARSTRRGLWRYR